MIAHTQSKWEQNSLVKLLQLKMIVTREVVTGIKKLGIPCKHILFWPKLTHNSLPLGEVQNPYSLQ